MELDDIYADVAAAEERRRDQQRQEILEILWACLDAGFLAREPDDLMAEKVLCELEGQYADSTPQAMGWVGRDGRP